MVTVPVESKKVEKGLPRPRLAVILAAGEGSRLARFRKSRPKPLVPLLGLSLVERTIATCIGEGIRRFVVVLGYRAEAVRRHLEEIAARRNCEIECVVAPDWKRGNGASARAAAAKVGEEPFLLLMADHLIDGSLIRTVCRAPLRDGQVCLAVDRDRGAILDERDVTKTVVSDGRVVRVGKNLADWNAADTGVFLCTRALFEELERLDAGSLSEATNSLAERGRLLAADATGQLWLDVDTPEAYREAVRRLLAGLGKPSGDGFISQYVNRPISTRLSALLAHTRLTPNWITALSFLISIAGAGLLALGQYAAGVIGALLVQFGSIVDGCDGEVARLKHMASARGAWLDSMLDRYADVAVALAVTFAYASASPEHWVWIGGFLAAWGFLLAGYVTKEFELRNGFPYPDDWLNRLKRRDLRLLIICAGALVGQPFYAMLAAGALTHFCIVGILIKGWLLRRPREAKASAEALTLSPLKPGFTAPAPWRGAATAQK